MGNLSKVVAAIESRLTFHAQAGGILDGVGMAFEPVAAIEGEADLPKVRMLVPDIGETPKTALLAEPSMTLTLAVSTRRADGIAAHLAAVEAVLDALEVNDDGRQDTSLAGTLPVPFTVRTGGNNVLDLSITTDLSLNLKPRPAVRGNRRQVTPTQE